MKRWTRMIRATLADFRTDMDEWAEGETGLVVGFVGPVLELVISLVILAPITLPVMWIRGE